MVSKPQPIHQLFEDCQEEIQLPIRSLKYIDTVRWNAREYGLDKFLKWYDSFMIMLGKITTSTTFDVDRRNTAERHTKSVFYKAIHSESLSLPGNICNDWCPYPHFERCEH